MLQAVLAVTHQQVAGEVLLLSCATCQTPPTSVHFKSGALGSAQTHPFLLTVYASQSAVIPSSLGSSRPFLSARRPGSLAIVLLLD